ncbi:MAG: sialidase family protein [Planctomycetota bacterium]
MIFHTTFYSSRDEGDTWSDGVMLNPADPIHVVRCGSLFVRSNGAVVAPVMSWMNNPPPPIPKDREAFERPYEYAFPSSYAMISSDEGRTWRRSVHTLVTCVPGGWQAARCGFFPFEEPTAIELADGRLMMIGRTNVGVPYRSFSEDGGMRWTMPVPMRVASSYSPLHVKRVPSTGDLVLIWNQASVWEMQHGLRRQRLSTAISKDEGDSWGHFRNLESLDDVAYVEPPPVHDAVDCEDRFWQPTDDKRYHRAPGSLRCAYPTAIFAQDHFIATYDYGCRQDTVGRCLLKVRSLPVEWLYEG